MVIYSFLKRLNATELGLGVTHDAYVAIPSEVKLSHMLENQRVITPINRYSGGVYSPSGSELKYVQTGQNNQERISGLGEFFISVNAKVGDEVLIEKTINDCGFESYSIDLIHRNAIVFQVNSINGKRYVEILPNNLIEKFADDKDYRCNVYFNNEEHSLFIKYITEAKKKKTSPKFTRFYDLLIDEKSILSKYAYQEYIEIITDGMKLERMTTYLYSVVEMSEVNNG